MTNPTIHHALWAASVFLLGCSAHTASEVDPFDDSPFALVLEGETVRPEGGWIQRTDQSSQMEIEMSGDWGELMIHLDVHRWERPYAPLRLEPGGVIVDGPADRGRGPLAQYTGDFADHSPWIDAVLCAREGAGERECFGADRITLRVESTADPRWVWVQFELDIAAFDEPVVGRYRTLLDAGDGLHDHYPR